MWRDGDKRLRRFECARMTASKASLVRRFTGRTWERGAVRVHAKWFGWPRVAAEAAEGLRRVKENRPWSE